MKANRWIHIKRAKFALNIIGWVETLQMQVFELKWNIHILITYLLTVCFYHSSFQNVTIFTTPNHH